MQTDVISTHSSPECSPPRLVEEYKLLVIYFHGVSCMGKSELLKRLSAKFHEKGIPSKKVSLDKIAKGIMDEYKTKNNYQGEEAFTLCMAPIFDSFHQRIIDAAVEMRGSHGVLMVDDCSLDLKFMKRLVDKAENIQFKVKFFKLYPEPHEGLKVHNELHINLSFQFVLNLCYRALNRGFHHTFNYCPEKKLQLVLSFVRVYELKLDAHTSSDYGLNEDNHALMEIEFHHEKDLNIQSPSIKAILKLLKTCLQNIVPFESPVVTARDDLRRLVDAINAAPADEIKHLLSYGRSEIWETKFEALYQFFL